MVLFTKIMISCSQIQTRQQFMFRQSVTPGSMLCQHILLRYCTLHIWQQLLLQVWSLLILQPPSPCRAPSWASSFSSLGSAPSWALVCWPLSPSRVLAGCPPTKTLVRDTPGTTLWATERPAMAFSILAVLAGTSFTGQDTGPCTHCSS